MNEWIDELCDLTAAGERVVLVVHVPRAQIAEVRAAMTETTNARAHVAFGFGIHRCMGNRLAELQLRILWEEIMQRFHTVELVGDVDRLPNNFIRGIRDVPVQVHPI